MMYNEELEEIRKLFGKDEYLNCLEKTKILLQKIKNKKDYSILYFCNFMMAYCFFYLHDIKNSIKYGHRALSYVSFVYERIRTYWLLSWCYETYDLEQALKYINETIKSCAEIENSEWLFQTLFHKAYLLNDIAKAKEIYSKLMGFDFPKGRVDEINADMCIICINNNEYLNAQIYINKIYNKKTKVELTNKLLECSQTV